MTRDYVADVNDNLRATFEGLAHSIQGGEVRQFGPTSVAYSGLPLPNYNRAFVFDSPPYERLAAAVTWLADRDVPFRVTATQSVTGDIDALDDVDLVRTGRADPGMVLAPLADLPSPESVADIAEVTGPDDFADFCAVVSSVFETPTHVVDRVYRGSLTADDERLFLGRVDAQAVACGTVIRTGDVAGIYTMAVVDEFRGRGIGEAMGWKLLRAGREAGCQVGALQASEMAYPLYEKMGFETVVTYHHFELATETGSEVPD